MFWRFDHFANWILLETIDIRNLQVYASSGYLSGVRVRACLRLSVLCSRAQATNIQFLKIQVL